jgi:hypothetical protein
MARNAIVQMFVDLFAARGVPGVFEFDDEEYTRQHEKRGDLDVYSIKILKRHIHDYYVSMGIRTIPNTVSTSLFTRLLEKRLLAVMRLNSTKGKFTRRQWLRATLQRCIDTVFLGVAPVIPLWHQKEDMNRQATTLEQEYNEIDQRHAQELARHAQELAQWTERKRQHGARLRDIEELLQWTMKESQENIKAVERGIFYRSESLFKQFVSE